ncbi:Transcriptional regulator, GntR family OS=Castellaniella defragrans (strain DSM / CCUG 39792/ 65Phen) OX=1437824 GN=BN940_04331 PE=4 SV=1 [Castellaniella denitrificans]|uniref:GntR family transcriptional regulator n=1 Tax=Castellaniella sp. TaxID=1955812 RepID=UPI002AFFA67F|nr:GntR family transcriptional regulator [Castellaniella sp.]
MAKRPFSSAEHALGRLVSGVGNDVQGNQARTLTELTYARLRRDIVEGHLVSGSKLRIEHLREQYGVGAGTLREALTRLVSDALVTAEGQRGFRVAPMSLNDLKDLTRLRVQIEIEALRLSIRHGDQVWRERLEQAFQALSSLETPITGETRPAWEEANMQFHEALLAGHGSEWTTRVLRLLARHGERYRSYAIGLRDRHRDVHAEHEEIYRYAFSGQEARAALALEAHIWATPQLLIQALRDGRADFPASDRSP